MASHNGAWVLVGRCSAVSSLLAANALLSHRLPLIEFGRFLIASSVVFVASTIGRAGLHQMVVGLAGRHLALGELSSASRVTRRCHVVAALNAAFLVAVINLGPLGPALLGGINLRLGVGERWLLALWVASETIRPVATESLRAYHRVGAATLVGEGGRNTVALLAVLLAPRVTGAGTAIGLAAGSSLGMLFVALALLFLQLPRNGPNDRSVTDRTDSYRRIVTGASLLLVAGLGSVLVQQIDIWIVARSFGASDVAVYGLAARVAVLTAFPLSVSSSVALPALSRTVTGDPEVASGVVQGTTALALLPSAAIYVGLAIVGPYAVPVVFGAEYRGVVAVALILALGQLLNVATGPADMVLILFGREQLVMACSVAGAMVMVLAAALASATGSLNLVATASAAASVLLSLLMMGASRRAVGVRTQASFRHDYVGAALARPQLRYDVAAAGAPKQEHLAAEAATGSPVSEQVVR